MISTSLAFALVTVLQQQPGAQPPRRPEPMPIPRTLVLHRGEYRIDVDGSLQDWPALPAVGLDDPRQLSGTSLGAYRGGSDLAGRFFFVWDESALYVGGKVQDDWHVRLTDETTGRSEVPPADSLVITIDPRRDTTSIGADDGRSDDVEFWLGEVQGQESRVVQWDRYRGAASFAEGAAAVVVHADDEKMTTYEARLPWSAILPADVEPGDRLVFDLQLVLSDFDEPTDPLPQTRIGWSFGMGPRIDPGLLGSAMLLSAPAADVQRVVLPRFPDPPAAGDGTVPDERYWIGLAGRLRAVTPGFVIAETPDPAFVGSEGRHEVLVELDRELGRFPRVDYLEFQHRIHRRMNRECAGFVLGGLPSWWEMVLDRVQAQAAEPVADRGFRLHRLPQCGFLVRSSAGSFAIDPSGFGIEKKLWGAIDFAVLTRPLEIDRRNDQLLVRMLATEPKRAIYTHIATHLPGHYAEDLALSQPGQTLGGTIRVQSLGRLDDDGRVTPSLGYRFTWPTGETLAVPGLDLPVDQVPAGTAVDVLILSPRHPQPLALVERFQPKIVVLDDVLQVSPYPAPNDRVPLALAFELQRALQPRASVVLAPGEQMSWPGS